MKFLQYIKALSLFFAVFTLLQSCKTKNNIEELVPADLLYNQGITQLKSSQYQAASESFEKIFFQYPGRAITAQAELMQAYSLYLAREYTEVVDILDIFIALHPRHQDISYAFYLKALAFYMQISDIKLDQVGTQYARESLQEVINRFPGSKYAIDSALKIDLANDHLAAKEMLIGRYYLANNNPIAALPRFQIVVQKYDTTSHIAEALYRIIESNIKLGLLKVANRHLVILAHNYPKNKWTHNARKILNQQS